jgi:hypothetical protein
MVEVSQLLPNDQWHSSDRKLEGYSSTKARYMVGCRVPPVPRPYTELPLAQCWLLRCAVPEIPLKVDLSAYHLFIDWQAWHYRKT